jgi:arsenate reductase-like glutaredoxin family protein
MSQKLSTNTIHGAPPQWSNDEYQYRVDMEVHAYKHTAASRERITHPLEHQWLKAVAAKCSEGFQVCDRYPVEHHQLSHSVYVIKPESMQAADIDEIKAKVKAEYVEWLESERTRFQDMLRLQLIKMQQEKELKALQEKEEKQMVLIEKEVRACYKPLVIPE